MKAYLMIYVYILHVCSFLRAMNILCYSEQADRKTLADAYNEITTEDQMPIDLRRVAQCPNMVEIYQTMACAVSRASNR